MKTKKSNLKARNPAPKTDSAALIRFRPYQEPVFMDRVSGLLILHWARQIGKSFVLAAWAVDRLLSRPGRLLTVLSNSRDNGAEFVLKAAEICERLGAVCQTEDLSPDLKYENMRMEVRITVNGKAGRIKVLAANPRTARGFTGDLILDEFAFHENSAAIWEAAEPIISSNPDFVCRIASTGNGKFNMFYRLATGGEYPIHRVTRTDAWKQGVKIYDLKTRAEISPDQARAKALDKRAYDQNYECVFNDENMTLLTHELINAAEREGVGVICEQDWNPVALAYLMRTKGDIFVGVDVGRNRDLTVISAIERLGREYFVRAILRIENMRLPQQQAHLGVLCKFPKFRCAAIDMTGIGLGLLEYSQDAFGAGRILGVNFSSTVPATNAILAEGRKKETVRITEAMATELLQIYEDRRIQHPYDQQMRDDLRKPERIVSPGGRVSIAAVRDEAGHADHFWSLALAVRAAGNPSVAGEIKTFNTRRSRALAARRERSCVA